MNAKIIMDNMLVDLSYFKFLDGFKENIEWIYNGDFEILFLNNNLFILKKHLSIFGWSLKQYSIDLNTCVLYEYNFNTKVRFEIDNINNYL